MQQLVQRHRAADPFLHHQSRIVNQIVGGNKIPVRFHPAEPVGPGVLLGKLTRLPFEHIPYRGGAASITDVLAGRIDFTIDVAPNVWPHVQAGRLTALGLGANHSYTLSSDLETIAENGVPGYELFAWDGIVVRKGTPEPIVKTLSEAVEKTLANEEIQKKLIARGAYPVQSTPESFRLFVTAEKKKWAELVKTSQTSLD